MNNTNSSKNNGIYRLFLIFIAIIGILFSFAIYINLTDEIKQKNELEFKSLFQKKVNLIKKELEINFYILKSLKSFSSGSTEISRTDFKNYVEGFLQSDDYKGLHAISWVPRIKNQDKLDYEERVSKELDINFKIKQRDTNGNLINVLPKNEYFPVDYIEPYELNKKAQGFDISSNETRLKTLNIARDTNKVTITAKIVLVQETKKGFGFLGVLPIWNDKKELEGYYSAVFRLDDILISALDYTAVKNNEINLWISDVTNLNSIDLLYTNTDIQDKIDPKISTIIDVGGRKWQISALPVSVFGQSDNILPNIILFFNIVAILLIIIILVYVRKQKESNESILTLNEELETKISMLKEATNLAKIATWNFNAQHKIIDVSPEFQVMFNIQDKSKITLNDFTNLICEEDREKFKQRLFNNDIKKEADIYKIEVNPNDIKHITIHWNDLLDGNKNLIFAKGYVQDVTDKVNTQKKEKEQQAIIIQQSRLVQLGELISMIAHQWRQPLTSISMWKFNLLEEISKDKPDVNLINYAASKMDTLITNLSNTIDDFRNFYKEEKDQKEFVLGESVNQAILLVENKLKELNIQVFTNIEDDVKIKSYDGEIRQIILALISNARDALMEKDEEHRILNINLYKESNKAIIEIIDSANGIPKEIQNKIFEPYFTTKTNLNGSGMGMYMIKMLLDKSLKGKINFETDHSGTKFIVELPLNV